MLVKLDGIEGNHKHSEEVSAETGMSAIRSADGGASSDSTAAAQSGGATKTRKLFPDFYGNEESDSGNSLNLANLGDLRSGEWWLGKLGIGLVLFGVVFLFTYSVQQGWLTPPVQVAIGLAVGIALLVLGLRIYQERRAFSRVLLGGGVGALYITGFASYQVHSLVPHALAFSFMVAVTVLACALSVRQSEPSLSVIGVIGGLGTPFLLYTGSGSVWGLVLYTSLILSGVAAVYLYKGWASMFAVSAVGGWLVLVAGYLSIDLSSVSGDLVSDRPALQAGVTFLWLLFWLAPIAREARPNSMSGGGLGAAYGWTPGGILAHGHTTNSPLLALGFTAAIWSPSLRELGWISLCGATVYVLAALALRRAGILHGFPRNHALVALFLFTLALPLLLRGEVLYLALAVEAAALRLVARRYADEIISLASHLLFTIIAVWLALRLVPFVLQTQSTDPGLSGAAILVDLVVIALAAGVSSLLHPREVRSIYLVSVHVALLLFLWRELATLPGGDGWVTVSWGIYASGLLVSGLRLDRTALVQAGLATLFAVVGKLFIVDLAQIEAIWRVLLFMGFGAAFLALSYYLRSLWQPGTGSRKRARER